MNGDCKNCGTQLVRKSYRMGDVMECPKCKQQYDIPIPVYCARGGSVKGSKKENTVRARREGAVAMLTVARTIYEWSLGLGHSATKMPKNVLSGKDTGFRLVRRASVLERLGRAGEGES